MFSAVTSRLKQSAMENVPQLINLAVLLHNSTVNTKTMLALNTAAATQRVKPAVMIEMNASQSEYSAAQ